MQESLIIHVCNYKEYFSEPKKVFRSISLVGWVIFVNRFPVRSGLFA